MFDAESILYLFTESPVHAGSGTGLGVVDLPIQRERATGYPLIQASGIKGKLRAEAEALKASEADITVAFGPDTNASDHAGALAVGDGRILLFPVRSLLGVFAWATSAAVLARLARDAKIADWQPINTGGENQALVAPGNDLSADGKVVLEEFAFEAVVDPKVGDIAKWLADHALPVSKEYDYWRTKFVRSLVILPEDAFRDFTQFSTEVISRIKLDNKKKTVQAGALWTEEHLPADTLLYAPVFASRPRKDHATFSTGVDVLAFVKSLDLPRMQLGGDETVGRGLVSLRWS